LPDDDADALVNPASPDDDGGKEAPRPGDRQAGGEPVDAAEDDPS
jgi:hypothetical protein